MSKITTEVCKDFLSNNYKNTLPNQWKRTSKYKDENKIICRNFEHPIVGLVVLQEINNQIKVKENQLQIEKNQSLGDDVYEGLEDDNCLQVYKPIFSLEQKKLIKTYTRLFAWEDLSEEEKELLNDENYIEEVVNILGDALPGCFEFDFCKDFVESENEKIKLHTKISDICLTIVPLNSDYDQHIGYLVDKLLPEDFDEVAECSFMVEEQSDLSKKSAVWLYKKLVNIGMTPRKDSEAFSEEFRKVKILDFKEKIRLN